MTSAHQRHFQEEDAEQLLAALAGVASAHIVTDDDGEMVEIHILATPELHPKQVVRNVESALSAGLGIQVDRRIVSVAQIRTETSNGRAQPRGADSGDEGDAGEAANARGASGPGGAGGAAGVLGIRSEEATAERVEPGSSSASEPARDRLEYVRYEARRDAERCVCRVVLRWEGSEVTGSGEGPDTAAGRAEAAARAVFDAMAAARPDLRVRLEGATLSSSRGRSFVIISAHAVLDRMTVSLSGAAVMSRSPEEAAILAALQAANRWSR